jgi:hypothetical protein
MSVCVCVVSLNGKVLLEMQIFTDLLKKAVVFKDPEIHFHVQENRKYTLS